jgi:hypothetical protein
MLLHELFSAMYILDGLETDLSPFGFPSTPPPLRKGGGIDFGWHFLIPRVPTNR